jgi:hypothetical protein
MSIDLILVPSTYFKANYVLYNYNNKYSFIDSNYNLFNTQELSMAII